MSIVEVRFRIYLKDMVRNIANLEKEYKEITSLKPDLIVTCAYGQILPKEILDCPKYGCINVHASCLPRWRGAAPIQAAILAGCGAQPACLLAFTDWELKMPVSVGLQHGAIALLWRRFVSGKPTP